MDGDVEQLRSMQELEADLAGYREELKQVAKASSAHVFSAEDF